MAPEVIETLIGRAPRGQPALLQPPPATILGNSQYSRHPVKNFVFPGLIRRYSHRQDNDDTDATISKEPKNDSSAGVTEELLVQGVLLNDLNDLEMNQLDIFEGDEYVKEACTVQLLLDNDTDDDKRSNNSKSRKDEDTADSKSLVYHDAILYLWAKDVADLDTTRPWSYEAFRQNDLEAYLRGTVQSMAIGVAIRNCSTSTTL